MAIHILLVNASKSPPGNLSDLLWQCGFTVHAASNSDAVVKMLGDGFVVIVWAGADEPLDSIRGLRSLSDDPIMVILERAGQVAVVRCLEAGADSVLRTPVCRRVLEARIRAMHNRRYSCTAGTPHSRAYRVGDLVIDLGKHAVLRGGQRISLTPMAFRLLATLAHRAGSVVRHDELVREVWGEQWGQSPELLRPHIRELRRRLGGPDSCSIITQRGVGYMLA